MKTKEQFVKPAILREVSLDSGASILAGSIVDQVEILSAGQEVHDIDASDSELYTPHAGARRGNSGRTADPASNCRACPRQAVRQLVSAIHGRGRLVRSMMQDMRMESSLPSTFLSCQATITQHEPSITNEGDVSILHTEMLSQDDGVHI